MKERISEIIHKLETTHKLSKEEYIFLLEEFLHGNESEGLASILKEKAVALRKSIYGNSIFIRGLIEFTNYCKNDCLYCGIRRSNTKVNRYRLTEEEIIQCTDEGYQLGFRTFVLQGGEDPFFTDEKLISIISKIKTSHPDCAIPLSIGERSLESYRVLHKAGADRYLLRHETATEEHYKKLHPQNQSFQNRMNCLKNLRSLGYAVGCGFMVGSPFQTVENFAEDLIFIQEFQPEMCGIGPFIPHKDTPFAEFSAGSAGLTCFLLSIIRLIKPNILLPATTALGTVAPDGREKGILNGANVIMPNLSPISVRKDYSLYDGKICTGEESAQCIACLKRRIESTRCEIVVDRGDITNIL